MPAIPGESRIKADFSVSVQDLMKVLQSYAAEQDNNCVARPLQKLLVVYQGCAG